MRAASNQTSSPGSTASKTFDVALVAHPSTSGKITPPSQNAVNFATRKTSAATVAGAQPSTPFANTFASQLASFPDDLNVIPLGYWEFMDIACLCTGDDILNPVWNTLFKEVAAVNVRFRDATMDPSNGIDCNSASLTHGDVMNSARVQSTSSLILG